MPSALSPALIVLIFPLGFRLSCYYYRKAYYRSFWGSPPACAVVEPHRRYTGETRFPLMLQRMHRYFFFFGVLFVAILTYDAVLAFDFEGHVGMGLGTLVLLVNAILIWGYTLGCHSCRHIIGGRLRAFSRHPLRHRFWSLVSLLNGKHMQWAWVSLIWIALTDVYIRLLATGTLTDPRVLLMAPFKIAAVVCVAISSSAPIGPQQARTGRTGHVGSCAWTPEIIDSLRGRR